MGRRAAGRRWTLRRGSQGKQTLTGSPFLHRETALHPRCPGRGMEKPALCAGQAASVLPIRAVPTSPTTPLSSQLPTSFVLHPLPHPEASGPVENSQENVLHTYHGSPQAPGAAPQFSCWGGLGLVTSKAVSPSELGDSMYREGFWGHRPRAFIFKIYINRHTYSFLKEHGNRKK